MGYKYEVNVWEAAVDSDRYYWLQIYTGDSLYQAIKTMWWCKRQGWKCIKLEWRP